jgi:hypothetical protein
MAVPGATLRGNMMLTACRPEYAFRVAANSVVDVSMNDGHTNKANVRVSQIGVQVCGPGRVNGNLPRPFARQ